MFRSLNTALFGFFLAAGLIGSSFIFSQAMVRAVPSSDVVKVRGVSERIVKADRVNWQILVSHQAPELERAYQAVDHDIARIQAFFEAGGVGKSLLLLGTYEQLRLTQTVTLDQLGNTAERFIGFRVTRTVGIRGYEDLDRIEGLAIAFPEQILRGGIEAQANQPYFYYSQPIEHIKPELLRAAAENAFERASIVAKSSASRLGRLKAARQGEFEGFSDEGFVGGHAREARISAVVTVDFALN